jgi:hypothetical protein
LVAVYCTRSLSTEFYSLETSLQLSNWLFGSKPGCVFHIEGTQNLLEFSCSSHPVRLWSSRGKRSTGSDLVNSATFDCIFSKY